MCWHACPLLLFSSLSYNSLISSCEIYYYCNLSSSLLFLYFSNHMNFPFQSLRYLFYIHYLCFGVFFDLIRMRTKQSYYVYCVSFEGLAQVLISLILNCLIQLYLFLFRRCLKYYFFVKITHKSDPFYLFIVLSFCTSIEELPSRKKTIQN